MDKLNFLTAGMPLQTGNKGYKRALEILNDGFRWFRIRICTLSKNKRRK